MGDKRRIHWESWERLCCSKLNGGLGFKELKSFKLALLAKQWWRILQNEKSLCFRVLKAKYFPRVDAKLAKKGQKASFLWNSLL